MLAALLAATTALALDTAAGQSAAPRSLVGRDSTRVLKAARKAQGDFEGLRRRLLPSQTGLTGRACDVVIGRYCHWQGSGNGPAGDILLTIHVSPHPHFRRTGNRLEVRVPITLAEAAQGGRIDVPTPHGVVTLTLPPNTSSGKRLRIKGQGVKPANQTPGDLFAEVQVVLPSELNDAERQQLAEVSNRHPQNPRSELRW